MIRISLYLSLCATLLVPTLAQEERGTATYASTPAGALTLSGALHTPDGFSAAHAVHPMGSRLEVTRLDNGASVQVIVQDRCAKHESRIINLSRGAAKSLGMLETGLEEVRVRKITEPFTDALNGTAAVIAERYHGRKTASGKPYDKSRLTAAHRNLPFGSRVRVTVRGTNRNVDVTITDRTGKRSPHILNLSSAAAERLELGKFGLATVVVKVLESPADPKPIKLKIARSN